MTDRIEINYGFANFGGGTITSNGSVAAGPGATVNVAGPGPQQAREHGDERRGTDVGVITILAEEAAAVREILGLRPARTTGFNFDVGTIEAGGKPVSIAAAQALQEGQESTMAAFQHLRQHHDPALMVLTGIAGGIHRDIRPGDVVVATRVFCYDLRKETPQGTQHRMQERQAPALIGHAVKAFFTDHGEPAVLPAETPGDAAARILSGPIASGNVVIANRDSEILRNLARCNDKILAVDMEAGGFSQAYHEGDIAPGGPLGWLVVRGISDDASRRKNDDYHVLAARNAARALRELIPYLPVTRPAASRR